MAYLPKNKYEKLYTNGDKYRLSNGTKPYTGEYIVTADGKVFAGKDPQSIIGRLSPINQRINNNINEFPLNNRVYSILNPKLANKQNNYIPIPSGHPPPTAVDYADGFFKRYIAVRLNTKSYFEISRDTFQNFKTRNYDRGLYKVF